MDLMPFAAMFIVIVGIFDCLGFLISLFYRPKWWRHGYLFIIAFLVSGPLLALLNAIIRDR